MAQLRECLYALIKTDPRDLQSIVRTYYWTPELRDALFEAGSRLAAITRDAALDDPVRPSPHPHGMAAADASGGDSKRSRASAQGGAQATSRPSAPPATRGDDEPRRSEPRAGRQDPELVKAVIRRAGTMESIKLVSLASLRSVFQRYDEGLAGFVSQIQYLEAVRQPEFVDASIFTSDAEELAVFRRFYREGGFAWMHFLEAIRLSDWRYRGRASSPFPRTEYGAPEDRDQRALLEARRALRRQRAEREQKLRASRQKKEDYTPEYQPVNVGYRMHGLSSVERALVTRVFSRAYDMVRIGRLSMLNAFNAVQAAGRFLPAQDFKALMTQPAFERACVVADRAELQAIMKVFNTRRGVDCYRFLSYLDKQSGKKDDFAEPPSAGKRRVAW